MGLGKEDTILVVDVAGLAESELGDGKRETEEEETGSSEAVKGSTLWTTKQTWHTECAPCGELCVLRPSMALKAKSGSQSMESNDPFDLPSLPKDLFPMIAQYLFDCELFKLASTNRALRRLCDSEFSYRAARTIRTLPRALECSDKQLVMAEHRKMETLYNALEDSGLFSVGVDYERGFPRAVCGFRAERYRAIA